MSVLQHPDTFSGQELQVWNNAAFDNGESEDSAAVKCSWSNLQSLYVNQSLESDCSKENLSPVLMMNSPVSTLKSSVPIKPIQVNSSVKMSQTKQLKSVSVTGSKNGLDEDEEKRDERKIDMEIEEIEKEISRLSSRLEALRIEKIDVRFKLSTTEKRGRIVPAKFKEQKQSFKNVDAMKKVEDSLLSAKSKLNRRGLSLGPAEIFSAAKSRQSFGKPELTTPLQSIQSRRKSCFWKLQDIDELKVTKERGKSMSLSPKSRKTAASKVPAPKQAMTTVGSKKIVKKEESLLSLIQPKKLFKDGEKSVPSKKPLKPGRIVASRYSQITNDARKRSLPENDKEESSRCDKRRASRENAPNSVRILKSETRLKKKWEIPQVVVYKGSSPSSVSKVGDVLPKIRTVQCINESPRDSGPAKRVAELVGRKSFFCADVAEEGEEEEETEEGSVCQALNFDEDGFEED